MAKVSIIIPIYNAEKTINRCLDAILSQTYKDFEVICVNDGSSDNSISVMKKYADKDSRIKVYDQENSGVAYTRNFAISQASGEYIMFCDADDWYEINMVETMVNTIEQEDVDFAMCDCNIVDISNDENKINTNINNIIKYHHIKLIGKAELNIKNVKEINVVLWNKIFKRKFLEKYNVVYPKKYEHDDLIFMLKLFAHSKFYYGVNEKLYNNVVGNSNSIMGNLYNSTNIGKEYDFINSYLDLFDYLSDCDNLEYIYFIKNGFIVNFINFIKYLPLEKEEIAFKKFKEVVNSSQFFKSNNTREIELLQKCSTSDEYKKKVFSSNTNFLQQIFSVKNEGDYKIIRILGIKMRLRREKECKKEPLSNDKKENIKILIAYHKKTPLLKNDICVPIHCGRKIAFEKSKDGVISDKEYQWLMDNCIGDDSGDNISHLNRKFNEMTMIYWAWKNYSTLGNPDYIGFMHYRTIFNIASYPGYENNYLDSHGYSYKHLIWQLNKWKVLSSSSFKYKSNSYNAYKELSQYGADVVFYDTFLDILKEKYPEDYRDINAWNTQQLSGPYKNMFITSKEEFFKYCEWIFPKLFELEDRLRDYPYENKEGSLRSIAWLSEILTSFYFWRLSKTVSTKELPCFRPNLQEMPV